MILVIRSASHPASRACSKAFSPIAIIQSDRIPLCNSRIVIGGADWRVRSPFAWTPRRGDDKLSVGKPAPARVLQAGDESLLSASPGIVQAIYVA